MFYQFFKQLVGMSLSVFFKKIVFIDKANLPKKGPVILVCNHPSAVIDPLIVATKINGELSYIAAAEWFGTGIKNWIFTRQFNMIPVYRPWIEKSKKKSNKRMFEACTNSLNKGSRIMIFPEGTSITTNYIRELKTGTARMKLDYENNLQSDQPLLIVPIGINYSNPHQFYSTVSVKVGTPINFAPYETTPKPTDEQQEIAKILTEQIQVGMEETVINNRPGKNSIVASQALEFLNSSNFQINKKLVSNINNKQQSKDFKTFENALSDFFDSLKENNLDISFFNRNYFWSDVLVLILLSPIYLLFIVVFGIPLLLAQFIFNQYLDDKIDTEYQSEKLNPSFRGSLVFLTGLAVLLVWIIVCYLTVGLVFSEWLWGLLIFILAVPLLKIGLFLHSKIKDLVSLFKFRFFERRHHEKAKKLKHEKHTLEKYLRTELLM